LFKKLPLFVGRFLSTSKKIAFVPPAQHYMD